jgi:hypothetical protein
MAARLLCVAQAIVLLAATTIVAEAGLPVSWSEQ